MGGTEHLDDALLSKKLLEGKVWLLEFLLDFLELFVFLILTLHFIIKVEMKVIDTEYDSQKSICSAIQNNFHYLHVYSNNNKMSKC